jgi:hypothetical protein
LLPKELIIEGANDEKKRNITIVLHRNIFATTG